MNISRPSRICTHRTDARLTVIHADFGFGAPEACYLTLVVIRRQNLGHCKVQTIRPDGSIIWEKPYWRRSFKWRARNRVPRRLFESGMSFLPVNPNPAIMTRLYGVAPSFCAMHIGRTCQPMGKRSSSSKTIRSMYGTPFGLSSARMRFGELRRGQMIRPRGSPSVYMEDSFRSRFGITRRGKSTHRKARLILTLVPVS